MNKVSSGSTRYPEGSIDTGLNLGHEVSDGSFFNAKLLIMFNPEISEPENIVSYMVIVLRFSCHAHFVLKDNVIATVMYSLFSEEEGGIPNGGHCIKGQVWGTFVLHESREQ